MNSNKLSGLVLSLVLLAGFLNPGSVRAGNRWWDGGTANLSGTGTGASTGGAGTWNTTIQNWDQGNGLIFCTWTNADNDIAIFAGTPGTVTIGSAVTANGLTFNTNGYVLTGSALTMAGTTPTITANTNAIISAPIAGTAGLTKAGTGTLGLNGANTYTGTTTVSAGTLSVGPATYSSTSVLSVSSGANVVANGTLNMNVNSSATAVDITGAGVVNLSSTTNSATYPDLYFGPNHSGTADYGSRLNSALNLGSAQRYVLAKSGRNDVARYGLTGCDAQFASSISGSGGLTLIGQNSFAPGVNVVEVPFAFNAANSFTGMLEIQRGSLYLGNASALVSSNVLLMDPAASTTNNARLFLYGYSAIVSDLQSTGTGTNILIADGNGATTANVGPATLTVIQNNSYTFGGALRDWYTEYATPATGSLVPMLNLIKQGAATLTLGGTNTYTGATTITAGTLQINGQLASGTYAGAITNNGTLVINSASSQTLSGVISGTGGLIKTNTGTLTLSNTNTYSGTTALNGGSISIANSPALGTNTLTVGLTASGTLTVANTSAVALSNNIVLPSPGSAVTVNIVKNSSGQTTGTQLNLAGTISGGNASTTLFLNSNTGGDSSTTYLFSGTNTFVVGEINLNRGAIVVANPFSMGDPGNLLFLDGNNNKTLGDLRFAASMTLPNPVQVVSGGSTSISTDTNNVVLTGTLSGSTFLKLGTGTLTLAAPSTYTGNTTISAGTLALTGTGTIPNTPTINLNNTTLDVSGVSTPFVLGAQTLQGSGNIVGALQDSGGSVFNPGGTTNVGTLSFNGNLTLVGSDTLDFDLGKTPTSAGGTNNDLMAVTGNLTINPGTTVNINPLVALAGGSYKLISYTGTLNGAGNTASWVIGNYTPSGRVTGVAISEATPGEIDLVVSGSPAPLVWQGDGTANVWDIQSTANWVNVSTPDYFYQFDNATFTDSGSDSPAIDIQAAVTPSSVTVSNTQPYTFISSVGQGISGAGGLTKNGAGTLSILNNNSYTGTTTVNGGTLVLGDGTNFDGTIGTSPVIDNATLKFYVAAAQTAAGSISGTGVVVQTGNINGTLTLGASNSWTGGLNIQTGTAKPGVNYGLPAGAVVNISSNAAFDFNGVVNGNNTGEAYTFNIAGAGPDGASGALVNSGSQVLSYASISNLTLTADATVGGNNGRWDVGPSTNSILNGQGYNLTKTGSCLLDVRPQTVTNLASINVNSGELRYEVYAQTNLWTSIITNYVNAGAALGLYATTVNYPVVVNGGTLQSDSGTATWLGTINLSNSPVFSTLTGAQVFDGQIYGPASLTIQGGTGSVTLAASNSYTAGTSINAGTLVAANANALGTGDVTINAGSLYFNFPSGSTNVITNNIALPATGTEEFTIQGPTNFTTVRLTGLISGSTASQTNNLTDTGVTGDHFNVLILDNPNNTFSGVILMNRGTLAFTSDAALGNASTILIDTWSVNGALRFDADNITLSASRSVILRTSGQVMPINVQGYHGTVDSVISGPGTLVKEGTGTLTLTAANTYTGPTTVSSGILQVNGSIATGTVTVQTNTTLAGSGLLAGSAVVQNGGKILGGDVNNANTLSVNTTLTLGDNNNAITYSTFKIAAGGIIAAHNLNVNGTNIVNILDSSLPVGTNTLITYTALAGTNGFAGFQLGTVPAGVTAQLLNTGTAIQLAITPAVIVATNPPTLTNSVSSRNLNLSWPVDHTGWRLLVQTNNLTTGISLNTNDWTTVAGSSTTNQVSLPIDATKPTEFYRLVYP